MDSEIQKLTAAYPVRRGRGQKAAFLEEAARLLKNAGYDVCVSVDRTLGKNRNLIAGSLDGVRLIFTAHYDTPARMFLPANILFPQNILLTFLFQLIMLLVPMAAAAWLAGVILSALEIADVFWGAEFRLLAALLTEFLLFFTFPNRHNANDNTSGVAATLETALSIPPEQRGGTAFVLFDNEEMGLLGSMAFAKKYRKQIENATVINLDCIGAGNEIRYIMSRAASEDERFCRSFRESLAEKPGKNVRLVSGKEWFYPSDQQNFKKNVAAAAFKKGKFGLYMNNIHVDRDRLLDEDNLSVVVKTLTALNRTFQHR